MHIIIASTRSPKIQGVKRAVERLDHFTVDGSSPFTFESVEAVSGVSDMPRSLEEIILGAKNRAVNAFRAETDGPVISVGVEGGLFEHDGKVFLQSWSCAFNGTEFHLGSSGAVELPKQLSDEVMLNGRELSAAIDEFSRQSDVRSNQGTYGILTDDLVTREDSFETSSLFALLPFFNAKCYSHSGNI
ncbi:MAG: DUF84 family protein [Bacteroidota bacterium]